MNGCRHILGSGRVSGTSDLAKATYTLCDPSLAGSDRVPRRRPHRDGHEHGRAKHPASHSAEKEFSVRGQRRRGPPLVDSHDVDPDGEAERHRSDGLAHRRPGARRLRANQSLAHELSDFAAVELDAAARTASVTPLKRRRRLQPITSSTTGTALIGLAPVNIDLKLRCAIDPAARCDTLTDLILRVPTVAAFPPGTHPCATSTTPPRRAAMCRRGHAYQTHDFVCALPFDGHAALDPPASTFVAAWLHADGITLGWLGDGNTPICWRRAGGN